MPGARKSDASERHPYLLKAPLLYCSNPPLTESRRTRKDTPGINAYHRHHAGGFPDVLLRVLSTANAGGGRDPLPDDSRTGSVHAALRQCYLRRRWLNPRANPRSCRAHQDHDEAESDPALNLRLSPGGRDPIDSAAIRKLGHREHSRAWRRPAARDSL